MATYCRRESALRSAHQLHAHRDALRRNDVAALAIGVHQQRDMRGTVRIVFEPLDLRADAVLVALEVDQAIGLLMAAASMPNRDVARVITARSANLRLGQRRQRLAFVQVRADDLDQPAPAG